MSPFNAYQISLWKCAADVQQHIDFYEKEIAFRGYAMRADPWEPGSKWPEDRVEEFIASRIAIIAELKEIQANFLPKT